MRISDWSSDVCASDLAVLADLLARAPAVQQRADGRAVPPGENLAQNAHGCAVYRQARAVCKRQTATDARIRPLFPFARSLSKGCPFSRAWRWRVRSFDKLRTKGRSEEHTSELQSLMRISY